MYGTLVTKLQFIIIANSGHVSSEPGMLKSFTDMTERL